MSTRCTLLDSCRYALSEKHSKHDFSTGHFLYNNYKVEELITLDSIRFETAVSCCTNVDVAVHPLKMNVVIHTIF
jgi:hypothetical protein